MKILILFLFFLISSSSSQEIKDKLCSLRKYNDPCQQISRTQTIACDYVTQKLDCAIALDENSNQLASLDPEQAVIAASLVSPNVQVIGEIGEVANAPYQTAVIVKLTSLNDIADLKNKRLCHPGFKNDPKVSHYVLDQLVRQIGEKTVIDCSSTTKTSTERKFQSLSSFFSESCISGQWSASVELDKSLKSSYNNLCKLCKNSNCNDETNPEPFKATLSCIKDKGDIAITTIKDAEAFFNVSENQATFRYLYENGTIGLKPSAWTKQIPSLILSNEDSALNRQDFLRNNIKNYIKSDLSLQSGPSSEVYEESLMRILAERDYIKDLEVMLTTPKSLKKYVEETREIPNEDNKFTCGSKIDVCVTEYDYEKCTYLRAAGLVQGLLPSINCKKAKSSIECLDFIQNDEADVAFIYNDLAYIAQKKNLVGVAYTETNTQKVTSIAVLLNKDSNIVSFEDLKGKRACIPLYGGIEWLNFINILRDKSVVKDSCDYASLINDFVDTSCIPGANSHDFNFEGSLVRKLCGNCLPSDNYTSTAFYCNADGNNKFFGDEGALKCLKQSDFAVVSINEINSLAGEEFSVLCKNGTVSSVDRFDVGCALNVVTAGYIVAKDETVKSNEIEAYFREVEYWFGQDLHKPFKVFERFNHRSNALFPDSTLGLSFTDESNSQVKNLKTSLKRATDCVENRNDSSADKLHINVLTTFIVLFLYKYF